MVKLKRLKKIQSHHLHKQWKLKLLAGKFTWGNKAIPSWVMSTNFLCSKVYWECPAIFCLYTSRKLSPYITLNFHWGRRWWDWIQATFWNLFYFMYERNFDGLSLKFKYNFRNYLAQLWMVFLPFPLLWRPSRNWVLPTSSSHHWSTCHWLVRWQIILDTEIRLPDLEESLKIKKDIYKNSDEVN